jgi:hypothetical protein
MPKKYQAIIDLKTDDISWTEAAKQAGYTGRWTSDGKGGVKQKSSTGGGQARRRRQFDRPSTDAASAEAKRLEQERLRINREAEMYGLEPTQIEHLADQSDSAAIKFGAAGDPSNKAIVRTSDARLKDLVKQKVGDDYAVTLDPSTESIKAIPKKYFDPLADPSTLPGKTIRPGLVNAANFLGKAGVVGGIIAAGGQAIAGDFKGAAGTAADTAIGEIPVVGEALQPTAAADATMGYLGQVQQFYNEKRGRIQSRMDRLRKRGRTLQAQQAEEELSAVPSGAINTP